MLTILGKTTEMDVLSESLFRDKINYMHMDSNLEKKDLSNS